MLRICVTIVDAPAVDISTAEAIWTSKTISTLSAGLDMNIIDAPSPVVATKLAIKNVTVSTAVRVECPPEFWGTNGECKPVSSSARLP